MTFSGTGIIIVPYKKTLFAPPPNDELHVQYIQHTGMGVVEPTERLVRKNSTVQRTTPPT